jgi:hypothetical protein
MQQTPVFQFASDFRVRAGIGTPPKFTIDMTYIGMGKHELELYGSSYIWPIMKIIVIVTALFYSRRIIFGA